MHGRTNADGRLVSTAEEFRRPLFERIGNTVSSARRVEVLRALVENCGEVNPVLFRDVAMVRRSLLGPARVGSPGNPA